MAPVPLEKRRDSEFTMHTFKMLSELSSDRVIPVLISGGAKHKLSAKFKLVTRKDSNLLETFF